MGGVKGLAAVGAVVALGLSLTACGGSSASVGVSSSASASSKSSASATSSASSKPKPAAAPLSADALKAALLPASDFATDVKWDMVDTSKIPADSGCLWLIYGGARGTEIASADALGDVFTDIKEFYERAGQYGPGGAASALNAMMDQAHGKCASYTKTLSDGQVTSNTTTVTPETGIGDKADLFVVKVATPSGATPLDYHTLDVEYGDVLVSVSCLGTPAFLQSCDLDAKAKKIAGQLKLT